MPYQTKKAFKSLRDATEQRLTGNVEVGGSLPTRGNELLSFVLSGYKITRSDEFRYSTRSVSKN